MTKSAQNDAFAKTSFLYGGNAAFIEQLYSQYQDNPNSVDEEWQGFFADLADDPDAVRDEILTRYEARLLEIFS